jgi:hypothetical protein
MSFLDKIRACNAWDPTDFIPFYALGERVGSLRPGIAEALLRWPGQFRADAGRVEWAGAPADFEGRTRVLAEVVETLVGQGIVGHLHGERYPLTPDRRDRAICLIDRASAPSFGARAFGQHLNGYVRTPTGIEMWIGRRAADRRNYPSKLDNLVAGGLPFGIGLAENLAKECREEADIPPGLAAQAIPVGAVTYCRASRHGLKPDVMYCCDLELPDGFVPRCTDGEVETFYRLPVAEVARLVRETDEFKLNCNLVILDFLIRHGEIDQEHPDYIPAIQGLRSPLP